MKTISLTAIAVLLSVPSLAAAQDNAPQPRRFGFEAGIVAGLHIPVPVTGLTLGPNLGLEAGARISLGPGALTIHVRGAWEDYNRSGTGTDACSPTGSGGSTTSTAPTSPCISAANGQYSYTLNEQTLTLGLPIGYRFLSPARAFTPYVSVVPELIFQQSLATAYNLTTREVAMRFGILGQIGAQYRLGPGALFLEAGYRWVPVQHFSTGNSNISVIAVNLGYRFMF